MTHMRMYDIVMKKRSGGELRSNLQEPLKLFCEYIQQKD